MKVCVLGNSHAVCWKQAGAPDGLDLIFTIAATRVVAKIRNRGGIFKGEDLVKGEDLQFAATDFDSFAIVGMRLNFRFLQAAAERSGTQKQRAIRKTTHLMSEACFSALMDGLYGPSNPGVTLARRLREVTTVPILLIPPPCEGSPPNDAAMSALLYERYLDHLAKVAVETGVTFLPQNVATMPTPGYTFSHFLRNENEDYSHMNADYGRIILADAAAALGTRPAIIESAISIDGGRSAA